MKSTYLRTLIEVAKREGETVTSVELGKILQVSQQTASRRIQKLEEKGLIEKDGKTTTVNDAGKKVLRKVYQDLDTIFREQEVVYGKLFSGLGEGKYYIAKHGYRAQIVKKLGFSPYPGTLNLHLRPEENSKLEEILADKEYILLEGFRDENRSFGDVKAYHVLVDDKIKGALLKPFRTHHMPNVVEIISEEFLRKKLNINDGSIVRFSVL